MDNFRWMNPSQPQTLQSAVMLAYLNSIFALLSVGFLGSISGLGAPIIFIAAAGQAAGGVGVANEKTWGYLLAIGACSVLTFARLIVVLKSGIDLSLIGLMFSGALLGLLLHEQSRSYQKIWFR
jgi:hypothetical protein